MSRIILGNSIKLPLLDFPLDIKVKCIKMRKKLILISLLLAGYALGYFFYLSLAIGFAISKFCGGKEEGRPGRVKSIVIPWRTYELHMHHWFISSLAGATGTITGMFILAPDLFYGFLGGMVFQGIYCYNDWHRLIKRKSVSLNNCA